jgi:hypothetical protein
MVAVPLVTAETRPVASIVATVALLELQLMVAESEVPVLETGCPLRVTDSPTLSVAVVGVTSTCATVGAGGVGGGGGGATVSCPPPLQAALPAETIRNAASGRPNRRNRGLIGLTWDAMLKNAKHATVNTDATG